jgi:hypothetical protein
MMRGALIVVAVMVSAGRAFAATSVLIGYGLNNEYVAAVACPDNAVCLDSLYRWEFQSTRTVAGPPISGRVRAVIVAHTQATPSYVRSVELFVVKPIDDPKLRRAYRAEYTLVALSRRDKSGRYCVPMPLGDIGLAGASSKVIVEPESGYHCIDAKRLHEHGV